MRIQPLFLNLFGLLKAYLLIIVVLGLMLLQFNIVSALFQFDFFFEYQQLLASAIIPQSGDSVFVLFGSFVLCAAIWLSYRPIILVYLFFKSRLHYLSVLSDFFDKQEFKPTDNLQSHHRWLMRSANKISNKLSIRCPKIIISASLVINAKAVPGLFHAPVIILTQGLVNALTADEIEAVLAHELAHIAMNDIYSMSITDLILSVTVWLPVYVSHYLIDCLALYKWRSKNIGFILSLFLLLFAYGFFALFFLNTLNRYYELRADKTAMRLVNIQSFVNALHRIHDSQPDTPWVLEWCMASTPKVVQAFVLKIFLSHPSLATRIEALQ